MRFLKGNRSVFARRRRENFGILGVGNAISKGKCAPKAREILTPPPSQILSLRGVQKTPPYIWPDLDSKGGFSGPIWGDLVGRQRADK